MPLIKSAKKKLKQDKKRTTANAAYKKKYKSAVKKSKTDTSKDTLKKTYSAIDKATKKGVIHRNKAARLKSQAAKTKKSK